MITSGTDHELSSVGFTIANCGITAGLKVFIFLARWRRSCAEARCRYHSSQSANLSLTDGLGLCGLAVFVSRVFLRFALVLRVAFFLIAMTASQFKVTLTGSRTGFQYDCSAGELACFNPRRPVRKDLLSVRLTSQFEGCAFAPRGNGTWAFESS
jgi:hypothetical protein